MLQLYDSQTIENLNWPETEQAQYAKRYIEPLIKEGIKPYVANVEAKMYVLLVDSLVFPVIVADDGASNSYICSPYEHYISYGRDGTRLIDSSFVAGCVNKCLTVMSKIIRYGKIDSVVYVNHWLFSTDLYPAGFTAENIDDIVRFLEKKFPNHAIVFRSINPLTTPHLQKILTAKGFKFIVSRQIHITKTNNESIFNTRIIKSDLKLWRENPYTIVDESQITAKDCSELLNLYTKLYIEQHSTRNPQYSLQFVQHLYNQRLLKFKILMLDGSYKGVAGYYMRDGILMCPFFGYDKNDPEHMVIYRLLNTALLLESKEQGMIFHQSAGSTFFRTIRRSETCLESMAIYTKHLPMKQKMSWEILRLFINTFAPKYMKKY